MPRGKGVKLSKVAIEESELAKLQTESQMREYVRMRKVLKAQQKALFSTQSIDPEGETESENSEGEVEEIEVKKGKKALCCP